MNTDHTIPIFDVIWIWSISIFQKLGYYAVVNRFLFVIFHFSIYVQNHCTRTHTHTLWLHIFVAYQRAMNISIVQIQIGMRFLWAPVTSGCWGAFVSFKFVWSMHQKIWNWCIAAMHVWFCAKDLSVYYLSATQYKVWYLWSHEQIIRKIHMYPLLHMHVVLISEIIHISNFSWLLYYRGILWCLKSDITCSFQLSSVECFCLDNDMLFNYFKSDTWATHFNKEKDRCKHSDEGNLAVAPISLLLALVT